MPAIVNTPANTQEPSKLKKILLAPIVLLAVGLLIACVIVFLVSSLVCYLILKALYKLGALSQEFEQRMAAFAEMVHVLQTTHNTDVNNAVNINVQELRKNYGEPGVENKPMEEIEDFINKLECIANNAQKDVSKNQFTEDEKNHALECLKRIKDNPDTHSGSGLILKQVLNLVWKACNDKDKKSADPNVDIDTRILQRKCQLVKQLIESQTEYGVHGGRSLSACFTGTFNSIISSLYTFEEFSFSQKLDKDAIKQQFEGELRKRGEELFDQLSNGDKKAVAGALSSTPATNFILKYVESFKKHPARTVLGNQKCDELVGDYLNNLQYLETISSYSLDC